MVKGCGVFYAERAACRAAEGVEVRARVQRFAEIPRKGPDVSAFAASDADVGMGESEV